MRVIGVLDLLAGRAVHARAGLRATYGPVPSVAGLPIDPGDALALARAYADRLRLTELYVADLDAILGGPSQHMLVGRLAALGATQVVVGLETLPSLEALAAICSAVGAERVAFSLDLRHGEPIRSPGGDPAPHLIAARAAAAGAGAVIVLDLARVGTGCGPDVDLIARVRQTTPDVTLLAGGGVRGLKDLERLANVGCDGALVATALHDGRLGTTELMVALKHKPRAATSPSG